MPKSPQTVSRFDCLGFLYEVFAMGLQVCELECAIGRGILCVYRAGLAIRPNFQVRWLYISPEARIWTIPASGHSQSC
jgi:hypothetical protein